MSINDPWMDGSDPTMEDHIGCDLGCDLSDEELKKINVIPMEIDTNEDEKMPDLSQITLLSPEAAKRKKKGFQVNAKNFCLTYAFGQVNAPFTPQYAIAFFLNLGFDVIVVAIEKCPSNGNVHYHIWICRKALAYRSVDKRCFTIDGWHFNISKRKDGKTCYTKRDFLDYIRKDNFPVDCHGIDLKAWYIAQDKHKESATSYIAKEVYENGLNFKELVADAKTRTCVMMHRPKIQAFSNLCTELKYVPMEPQMISEIYDSPACVAVAKWWNNRVVRKKFKKKCAGLYLWSVETNRRKSTFIYVAARILNGSQSDIWTFTDKKWQEWYHNQVRILCIDGLQGPWINFSFLESMGSGQTVTIPKRQEKYDNRFKGPFVIGANAPWKKLGYRQDDKIMTDRLLSLCLDEKCNDLIPVVDSMILQHGLDPADFNIITRQEDDFPDIMGVVSVNPVHQRAAAALKNERMQQWFQAELKNRHDYHNKFAAGF